MTGELSGQGQDPSHKLLNIEQFSDTPVDSHMKEFARLLSDRVSDGTVSAGFVMASNLLVYDLAGGINGFTSEPIESDLVKQSPDLYSSIQQRLPELAQVAYSAEFAEEVREHVETLHGKPNEVPTAGELMTAVEHRQGVECVGEIEGIKLYTDGEAVALAAEFDPKTYATSLGSAYGDAALEMVLAPIVELAKQNGEYLGLDREGFLKLAEKASGFMLAGYKVEELPDLRAVEFEGTTVYFPTEKLVESLGVTRKGVDAPEAPLAGVMAFLMKNSNIGDETPTQEQNLPEAKLPGLDPFDMVRRSGSLPERGILFEAKIVRGGNAVFSVYDYDNLHHADLSGDGKYQYMYTSFDFSDDSKARQLEFGYEQPNYFDRDTQPYDRGGVYSYIPRGFNSLDAVDLADQGRLLISKEPHKLGNLSTRLDQAPWANTMFDGATRKIVRWFPEGDIDRLVEAVGITTEVLMGLEEETTGQIQADIRTRLVAEPANE